MILATSLAPTTDMSAPPVSKRRIATNTIWNVGGQVLPLLVGIAVLPLLISKLGIDRYGFITLVWVLIGYAGLFDFGISRAMTRIVAHRLARGENQGALHVANVSTNYLLAFGLVLGVAMASFSELIVGRWLNIPPQLHQEALHSMWLLSASIPVVMLSTGYRGCLEAYQKFGLINMIRVVLGIATYLGPLVALMFSSRLEYVVAFVVFMRFVSNYVHSVVCRRHCGFVFRPAWPDASTSRELFALGGWISVSNLVSPLLTYLDRLILGGLVLIQMVAYYATSYDLVSKMLIIPFAMTAALFPVASGLAPGSDAVKNLYLGTVRVLFMVMFPVVFAVIALAKPGLQLWLGVDFAQHGAPVLQVLAFGILLNTLAQAPATMIQAAGHPKWMAIVHVIELPIFVLALWLLTREYGILGTAMAAAGRFGLDALILFVLATRNLIHIPFRFSALLTPLLVATVFLVTASIEKTALLSLLTVLIGIPLFAGYAWFVLLKKEERSRLIGLLASKAQALRKSAT